MRAARFHAFGQDLSIDEVEEPHVEAGEAMFEVAFAAVNPLDVWVGQGTVAGGRQRLPFVPGSEASGLLGGRRVLVRGHGFGVIRDGFYRARASVPPDAAIPIPDALGSEAAACLGVAGGTAWQLVHGVGAVTAEDRVLVLGASGGVGSLLAQLAAATGATVWGQTSDAGKRGFVQDLGIDRAVVARAGDLLGEVSDLSPTVAFDPLGDGYTAALVDAVAPFGRIVLFGASAGEHAELDLRQLYRRSIQLLTYSGTAEPEDRNREAMEAALDAAVTGSLRVFVDEILPMDQAADALRRIRERRVRGKLLLRP
jgi:NADPH2:quinone reductase